MAHRDPPDDALDFEKIEALLDSRGVTLDAFCRRIQINTSTWRRWRSRLHAPHPARLRAVRAEIKRIVSRKGR